MDGGTGQAIPAVRVAPQLLSGSMFRDLADFVYLHDEARTRCPVLQCHGSPNAVRWPWPYE